MSRIRETLRLHLQAGLSYNEVGCACAAADALTDEGLEAKLYRPPVVRSSHQLAPDSGAVHQKLAPVDWLGLSALHGKLRHGIQPRREERW